MDETAEDIYLSWADTLASRVDQLQAGSDRRHLLGDVGLDTVIVYLATGVAGGVLSQYGANLADGIRERLTKAGTRRRKLDAGNSTVATPQDGVSVLGDVRAAANYVADLHALQARLIADLEALGFEQGTARSLATDLLQKALGDAGL